MIILRQKKMKKYTLLFSLFIPLLVYAQKKDSVEINQGKFFANLYTGFYYRASDNAVKSGFNMPTALFGYKRNLNSKVSGIIIFDVTRTTNNIQVTDSSGNYLNVSYFEGSKYTVFLKMAEIDWRFIPEITLSVGQLLNTQYLTFQDKFWAHRYVQVTFQELFRLGMPADFGARLSYEPNKQLKVQIDACNGEGPFRYQDENSDFIYSGNIEYKPVNSLIFKFYYSNHQPKTADSLHTQQTVSFFAGYKSKKITVGQEIDYLKNSRFSTRSLFGLSSFACYDFTKAWQIFYRFDYLDDTSQEKAIQYHIAGIQYKPAETFYISANYRYFNVEKTNMIFVNFGLKI